ncbi:DUF4767 domain-containing protein [Gemella haemolysans]|uniref:DUF4767 domain-containing protein n=1 Tax=Gemella haemolysans ATCC 10379 TaxID=546270 RepID=C5NVY1_9BACL|nr:DUF4767 domain-containing protein [Gemella haemolysans]EER68547.1 hypothetical protein GEMHA0001_0792 [Gemella haemolysans ATCC 10379]KAA8706154.1 DUF4767 domain-containing protein [Gemella haemolysans]UBH82489.1 DUF4767 domain-containing protein [Gemella haemolysans]VEI39264.1 Uncharacterised protein [Gemella haemolysans]
MKNRNNKQNNEMNSNQNGYYDQEGNYIPFGYYDQNGNYISNGYYNQDGKFIPNGYYDLNGNFIQYNNYNQNDNNYTPAGYYDQNGYFMVTGYYDQDGNYVETDQSNFDQGANNQNDQFTDDNRNNDFLGNSNYANVNQGNNEAEVEANKKNKPNKKSSKIGFIVALLLVCVLAAGVYYFKFYNKDSKVVHIDQYKVELAASGTNRTGKVDVNITEVPEVKDADENIKKFLRKPEVKYSPKENLENGSKVDVEITLNKEEAEKKGLKLTGSFKRTLTVTGLLEENSSKKEEIKTTSNTLWNKEKSNKLYKYVKEWEKTLNQSYKEYTPSNQVNFHGLKLPTESEMAGDARLVLEGDKLISMKWSPEGNYKDVYNIVAVFSDIDKPVNSVAHLYYFTILNGEPIVLITEQNQGNSKKYVYFRRTANVDLQKGFENIVKSS